VDARQAGSNQKAAEVIDMSVAPIAFVLDGFFCRFQAP
jgi:hypothetical protein